MLSRKVLTLTKPKGIKRNPSAIILQFEQPRPGFELRSLISFPMPIIVMLSAHSWNQVCIYPNPQLEVEYSWFEFRVFLLSDWLLYQSKRAQSVLTQPLSHGQDDTRSIFNQSKAGFNSVFSFSQTGCHSNDKEPNLPSSSSNCADSKEFPDSLSLSLSLSRHLSLWSSAPMRRRPY